MAMEELGIQCFGNGIKRHTATSTPSQSRLDDFCIDEEEPNARLFHIFSF
jgi:hypothetical protein